MSLLLRSNGRLALGLAAAAFWFATAATSRADDYPLVFTSAKPLRSAGFDIAFASDSAPLRNKCYYYGDGGYRLSMSDEFLARFTSKGFTLQSACLGLISNTRYDPETGRRLATYMIIDKKSVVARNFEPGAATEELPLELPPCFKNANPYTDCAFRFGRISGKPLTADQTATYVRLGAAIDAVMAKAVQGTPADEKLFAASDGSVGGFREPTETALPAAIDDALQQYSSFSLWARSSAFPRGYGYALDADGAAGPSLSAAAMNAAIAGSTRSQVSVDAIKRALESGRQQ